MNATTMPRLLVLMGSGETAPTMNATHREVFERLETAKGSPISAVVIDTPFGFQENHPILAAKTAEHFDQAIHKKVEVAGLPKVKGADPVALESAVAKIRDADWLFAGPGSPTYTLDQWRDSAIPAAFSSLLKNGGALVLSSAAVLTVGRHTIPVYEIYKAGFAPYWERGLRVLDDIDLPAVVIPHYNNNEGGNHDTSKCYLGERRLSAIEDQIDEDAFILGIDEHTGLIIDLDAQSAEVVGKGEVTVRKNGVSTTYYSGAVVALEELKSGQAFTGGSTPQTAAPKAESAAGSGDDSGPGPVLDSLGSVAKHLEQEFNNALETRDAQRSISAALELEEAIVQWSRDSLQSDDLANARQILRSMILKLGTAADKGVRDPREVLGPVIEAALAARVTAREEKAYAVADAIRDNLVGIGIEIQDSPTGSTWNLEN